MHNFETKFRIQYFFIFKYKLNVCTMATQSEILGKSIYTINTQNICSIDTYICFHALTQFFY